MRGSELTSNACACVAALLILGYGALYADEAQDVNWRGHLDAYSAARWRLFGEPRTSEKGAPAPLELAGPRVNVFDRPGLADAALRNFIRSRVEAGATFAEIQSETADQLLWHWITVEELHDVTPLYTYSKVRGDYFDGVKEDLNLAEFWVYRAGYGEDKEIFICVTVFIRKPESSMRVVKSIIAVQTGTSGSLSIVLDVPEYSSYRHSDSDQIRPLDTIPRGNEVPDVLLARGPLHWDVSHEEELELFLLRFAGGGEPWTMLSYVRVPYASIAAYDPQSHEIEVHAQIDRNPDEESPRNDPGSQRIVYKVANGSIAELPERREVLIAPSPPPQQ